MKMMNGVGSVRRSLELPQPPIDNSNASKRESHASKNGTLGSTNTTLLNSRKIVHSNIEQSEVVLNETEREYDKTIKKSRDNAKSLQNVQKRKEDAKETVHKTSNDQLSSEREAKYDKNENKKENSTSMTSSSSTSSLPTADTKTNEGGWRKKIDWKELVNVWRDWEDFKRYFLSMGWITERKLVRAPSESSVDMRIREREERLKSLKKGVDVTKLAVDEDNFITKEDVSEVMASPDDDDNLITKEDVSEEMASPDEVEYDDSSLFWSSKVAGNENKEEKITNENNKGKKINSLFNARFSLCLHIFYCR